MTTTMAMKAPTSFEIKIAFCGYVNSGKSTLVNALLQQKYSEVSMHCSALAVNAFRIFSNNQDKGETGVEDFETISPPKCTEEEDKEAAASSCVTETLLSALDTHQIIAKANVDLRDADEIKESTFNIKATEAICDMRDDTQLVVVDLPGITNVTSDDDMVVKYLNAKWDSYDCVVVVLDVMEAIDKQKDLMNLVRENLNDRKVVPVIFVCNKVDHPSNQEVVRKLDDLRSHVGTLFALSEFIPMCSNDAMIYRATSCVSLEQLKLLDMEWIDKVGIDEFGRSKWRKLSTEEKYEATFKTISDGTAYDDILLGTNFPMFLNTLKQVVGGSTVQLELIKAQLSVALKAVQTFDNATVATISKIKLISERLGVASDMTFNDHFWSAYKRYVAVATEAYKMNTDHKVFHLAMSQLIAFDAELAQTNMHETEHGKVVKEMISLIRIQLLELLKYAESWQKHYLREVKSRKSFLVYYDGCWKGIGHDHVKRQGLKTRAAINQPPQNDAHHWYRVSNEAWKNKYTEEVTISKYNPVTSKEDWFELSMRDFEIAFASILLASSCKPFWFYFGDEKIRMDSLLRQFDYLRANFLRVSDDSDFHLMFESITGSYNDEGKFVPANVEKYNVFVHFEMPNRISDPEHWGHLAWMFCEFMEKSSYPMINV